VTVIAWDGRTLAADKRAHKYGLAYTVTKVFRVGADRLVGISGDASRGAELIAWLERGGDPASYPELKDKDCPAFMLCVERGGRVLLYEKTAHPYVCEDEKWAEGEGRDFAVSAMHAGMDARAAVEWACRFVISCGNGIDALTFDG
jgi:hypothetical protein